MAGLDRYRDRSTRERRGRERADEFLLEPIEFIEPNTRSHDQAGAPPPIELAEISTYFGTFAALDKVSLTVEEGAVVGIVGPSGSGKSTLIRTINQLEPQTSGQVRLFGAEIGPNPEELRWVRENVGMVFQHFNLFPQFTVLRNVTLALRLVHDLTDNEATERATQALERVSMIDHRDKRPHQLSGGEQQRVALARALVGRPRILLLDEPTASIDPELTKGVMNIVAEVAAGDVTVVVVTHEMGFIRAVADDLVMVDGGRIIETGSPGRMLDHPRHERTARFLADVMAPGSTNRAY